MRAFTFDAFVQLLEYFDDISFTRRLLSSAYSYNMLSSHLICTALFALPAILAFRDSSPLLIWSSESYVVLAILSRLTFTLMFRSDDLKDAAREITSGVIPADEIYATMASLGCNWETMVVAHVEDVSDRESSQGDHSHWHER